MMGPLTKYIAEPDCVVAQSGRESVTADQGTVG